MINSIMMKALIYHYGEQYFVLKNFYLDRSGIEHLQIELFDNYGDSILQDVIIKYVEANKYDVILHWEE